MTLRGTRWSALLLVGLMLAGGCITERVAHTSGFGASGPMVIKVTGLAPILRVWNGDYPVARLDRLPDDVRDAEVGYIADPQTFAAVWQFFQPGLPPKADFTRELILFVRNVDSYDKLSIVRVELADGVAQPAVVQARSPEPITDKVAMSMVLVARSGIVAIQSNGKAIPLPAAEPLP